MNNDIKALSNMSIAELKQLLSCVNQDIKSIKRAEKIAAEYVPTEFEICNDIAKRFTNKQYPKPVENAKLKAKLFNLAEKQGAKPEDLPLNVSENQIFNLISARVVNNSISLRNNFLSLNKGRKAGITENQGVIGENGVIGITKAVNDNYTTVMSIFNSQTKISARIKDKGYFGSLVWSNNGDVRYMTLNDIPKHVPIKLGDKVETSGYSNLFPSGIMLGKVVGKKIPPGSSTYELKVKLYQDMTKIKFAYVVINYETPALDSLYLQTKSL
jgi:rod shape-determining protein MreC